MPPRLRFAPSPTGRLHLGNARVALINKLFAVRHGGRACLRIDDTDKERSSPAFEAAIRDDLAWLGLDFDPGFRQSERTGLYDDAFKRLEAEGRVYPCTETAEELAALRARLAAEKRAPAYRRRFADPDPARPAYWRFELPSERVAFADLIQGGRTFRLETLSDPVVRRADGGYTYTLASVVDDALTGITHLIRGEDHLTNTAVQSALFEALGAPLPATAHLPLLLGPDGAKLSKRLASLGLADLRAEAIEPQAILAHLATLGTGSAPEAAADLGALADGFDLAAYNRAAARLNPAEIEVFSIARQRAMPFPAVEERLAGLGIEGVDEALWRVVRDNIKRLAEVADWQKIVAGPIEPVVEDADLAKSAAALLPETLDEPSIEAWLNRVKAATGRKGKALFHPLRLAVTGRGDGPGLKLLLPQLGFDKVRRRLMGERA